MLAFFSFAFDAGGFRGQGTCWGIRISLRAGPRHARCAVEDPSLSSQRSACSSAASQHLMWRQTSPASRHIYLLIKGAWRPRPDLANWLGSQGSALHGPPKQEPERPEGLTLRRAPRWAGRWGG